MAKYLKPLKMFEEGLKRTQYENTVFLGLNFGNKYVSMAISDDCYVSASAYRVLPRHKGVLDDLVYEVQNLVKEIDLEGIIVANNYPVVSPVNIHNLMDDLCKKGKFESLKYTCWKDNITSRGAEKHCELFRYMFHLTTFALQHSQRDLIDASSALHMLRANLDFFNALVGSESGEDPDSEDSE